MKYKIIQLDENEIQNFNGKIIHVIDSSKQDVMTGRDYLGLAMYSCMWVLTCLVEVEDNDRNY